MEGKTTLVLGASLNPERYSNMAIKRLRKFGHKVLAIGLKSGRVGDVDIQTGLPEFPPVNTVTLYLSPKNQHQYYDYILSLKPERIIFNPGAENDELARLADKNNIESLEACTLVMLSTNQF